MTLKKAQFPVASFKAIDGGEGSTAVAGEFEAIVSVFGNVDVVGDRVVKGAFANTIERWKARMANEGKYVPIYYSHQYADPGMLLGRVIDLEERDEGLWVKGQMFMRKDAAVDVYEGFKEGVLDQFSFAYDVKGDRKDGDVTELTELELHEVGPTPIGANRETQLVALKSYQLADEKAWVGVRGSMEEQQRRIEKAVREYANEQSTEKNRVWAYVEATFEDRVVATIEGGDDTKTYEFTYTVNDDGEVELGDPREVEITGTITPKARLAAIKAGRVLSAKNETLLREAKDRLSTVLSSLKDAEKAGRVLSSKNEEKVQQARDLLTEVLSTLGDDGGKAGDGRDNVELIDRVRTAVLKLQRAELSA